MQLIVIVIEVEMEMEIEIEIRTSPWMTRGDLLDLEIC